MRFLFVGLTLLSSATLPLTASADPVDNFTLTGNGNTYTWSLPADETYPDLPHLGLLDFSTNVTVNGTTQTEEVGFYTIYAPAPDDLFIPQIPDTLYGPLLAQISDGSPGYVDITFPLGTFDLDDYHFSPSNPPGQSPPPTPYTLVITQQDAAATPEPSALVLLGTALLVASPLIRRHLT
jgi:hypothetical protein